jgi:hypothetical protein
MYIKARVRVFLRVEMRRRYTSKSQMKLSSITSILLLSAIIGLQSSQLLVLANDDIDVNADGEVKVVSAAIPEVVVCNDDGGDESCVPELVDDSAMFVAADEVIVVEEEEEDPKCPSRPHIIRCAAKYLDTNDNGALERTELDDAMAQVSWIVRGLLKVIGSTDTIMKKCDADGDGKITIEQDMEATKETCLATCFKRKVFKQLFFPDCTE